MKRSLLSSWSRPPASCDELQYQSPERLISITNPACETVRGLPNALFCIPAPDLDSNQGPTIEPGLLTINPFKTTIRRIALASAQCLEENEFSRPPRKGS